MPISDELEALRQSSRVKTQSTRLSTASSTTILSPQQQEELRKEKLTKEKQSKLEAERALRLGATYNLKDSNNLLLHDILGHGLYGRLMNEHRKKVREAQKRLHEWKGSHQGGNDVDESDDINNAEEEERIDNENNDEDDVDNNNDDDDEQDESTIISNAVELLPDHIVRALKEKYETTSIEEALTKALKEEERGALSKVMINAVMKKEEEEDKNIKKKEEGQQQQQQQQKEAEEEQQKREEQQGETEEETAEAEEEEKPIEEVREKIENLSINDAEVEGTSGTAVAIDDDVEIEESSETTTTEQQISPTKASAATAEDNLDCIEQTKLFYNKHANEFIAQMNKNADALTPTTLRDSFLNHLQEEMHLVTKTLRAKLGETNNNTAAFTIIDLGCGHGRDTRHFASLGHHVLAVDFSYAMLHHAKTIAPRAHYLNMDMRMLKNLLVDQSVDGIWSHASLSHLPKEDLDSLLKGLYVSIKVGGVLYFSVKIGTHDQIGQAGEVVEPDTRYTAIDNEKDTCKLYSYYTSSEVVELLSKTGWEVIKMGEFDQRDKSDYPTHSLLYVFATRRKD